MVKPNFNITLFIFALGVGLCGVSVFNAVLSSSMAFRLMDIGDAVLCAIMAGWTLRKLIK